MKSNYEIENRKKKQKRDNIYGKEKQSEYDKHLNSVYESNSFDQLQGERKENRGRKKKK